MDKQHHITGHILYAIGSFILLFTITLLQPINIIYARALNASVIIEQTNSSRNRLESKQLRINQSLMSAAQAKAEDMVNKRYFDHYGPSGETPWQFFLDNGYTYEIAGENLAITNEAEDKVIEGWLNSPTHRENLLNNQFSDIGIGIAYYGSYLQHKNTTVVVAFYGRPKSAELVAGTEKTIPAGTLSVVNNTPIWGLSSSVLAALAIGFIIAGMALEIRHIKKHHKQHQSPI